MTYFLILTSQISQEINVLDYLGGLQQKLYPEAAKELCSEKARNLSEVVGGRLNYDNYARQTE